jgi:hypothetical protein
MTELKACFGRCGNLAIRYRDVAKEHYVFTDTEKMKECNGCNLFTMCMFQTYNDMFKYVVRLVDAKGRDLRPRIG